MPDGFTLIRLSIVDSTNAEALRLAQMNAPANTLIWGEQQTHGRGRRGRTWDSPFGNLYCSLLTYPTKPADQLAQLAFVAALALSDGIAAVAPDISVEIKWPNDLLVGGRKIAGVLLEGNVAENSKRRSLVIGMGVNVSSHPENQGAIPATSLAREGANVSVNDLLVAATHGLERWIGIWEAEGFAPIRTEWMNRAIGIGEKVEVRMAEKTVAGIFRHVDDMGALVISTVGGDHTVNAGDVFLIGPGEG
ncbi:MAG: biotin--[acetyl-CoA-carboxylase] ligase [Alphaproteobacteria bacterium]|nr:biotin--[acetyl-CoA-carboxylase] ligase [Alphaproteobacteria bacterium]MBT4711042.1 biotin--[acetyl-CoA-carboxylase] ligase [Alphaproteobacteria bacterium]